MIKNTENFNKKVDAYCEVFSKRWTNEKVKWEAVKQFQENFNIESSDLAENLNKSINKHSMANKVSPRGMLISLARYDAETMRNALKVLFNESQPLASRIESFLKTCNEVKEASNKNNGTKWGVSGQNPSTATELLELRYPDKYFGYREWISKYINEYFDMGYTFSRTNKNRIQDSENAQREIRDLLAQNNKFKETVYKHIDKNTCFEDKHLTLAASDFCFWVAYQEKKNAEKEETTNEDEKVEVKAVGSNYWWITANPKEFSFSSIAVGEVQDFGILNDNGNRKSVPKNFDNAKLNDMVILYESDRTQEIVGLGQIEHENNGTTIGVRLVERFGSPILKSEIKDLDELKNAQPLVIKRGTLFALTKDEYDAIYEVIREFNPSSSTTLTIPLYSEKDFLNDVFMSKEMYGHIRAYLENKLNIIFQGPPGVGKTYAAKKLAYSIMGKKDESCIEFIQFHQNYSYEDFILGYKPDNEGFKLEEGIFTRFCRKAIDNPNEKYFFIIDEINRGNMSKIFGELLMAIENGYRNTEVSLAYAGRKLKVPSNLYIIGMMNTADRSLAMIDYALRRRFGFVTLIPGFESQGFKAWQKKINYEKFDKLIECIKTLNNAIKNDDSLGEGFCIGHSYFSDMSEISKYTKEDGLIDIVRFEILPMLEEYWFDEKETYKKWETELKNSIR